jgi:hypothetical protein
MAAKRKSAFTAVMNEAQQQHGETVTRQDRKTAEEFEKTTFYLTAEQADK